MIGLVCSVLDWWLSRIWLFCVGCVGFVRRFVVGCGSGF